MTQFMRVTLYYLTPPLLAAVGGGVAVALFLPLWAAIVLTVVGVLGFIRVAAYAADVSRGPSAAGFIVYLYAFATFAFPVTIWVTRAYVA